MCAYGRFSIVILIVFTWACVMPATARQERLASRSPDPTVSDMEFLDQVAQRTWQYLSSDWATDHHLPWSWRSATISGGDFVNPAEIGLYMVSWIGAYELGRPWSPDWAAVEAEVGATLGQLRAWQVGSQTAQPHGPNAYQNSNFYQWYWLSGSLPVVGGHQPGWTNQDVPSVDNAWLAASLMMIRTYSWVEGHPQLAELADAILQDMDFRQWYHPVSQRFSWGAHQDPQGGGEIDLYSNENRIINFVARALGHLTEEEFAASIAALDGTPGTYAGHTVAQLAWDGSIFTYLAPALFVREAETSYGEETILPVIRAQIAYVVAQGYITWGLSDCFDIRDGGYIQQGAPPAASPNPLEERPGVATAHASALALITALAPQATANLRTMAEQLPNSYHDSYGFYDSVQADPSSPDHGVRSERFSAIAQAWLLLALVNHESGLIWEYFYQNEGVLRTHIELYGGSRVFAPLLSAG